MRLEFFFWPWRLGVWRVEEVSLFLIACDIQQVKEALGANFQKVGIGPWVPMAYEKQSCT